MHLTPEKRHFDVVSEAKENLNLHVSADVSQAAPAVQVDVQVLLQDVPASVALRGLGPEVRGSVGSGCPVGVSGCHF